MEAKAKTKNPTFIAGTLTRIPVRAILDDPDGEIPHRELDREHVNTLAKDIERNGLDVPLIVWNGGGTKGQSVELEDGKIIPASFLVAGMHRRAALKQILKNNQPRYKELFPDGIPVIVRSGEIKDVIAAQLRENVQRKDMEPRDVLPFIKKMRDEYGMKQKEIAKAIGKSDGWVSQIFDIEDELGEEVTEELSRGGAKLSHARDLASKVKKAKKAGKPLNVKEEVTKMKAKAAKNKAAGRVRDEKKVSAKKVWARYSALPHLKMGAKLAILENALGYLAGDEEYAVLPTELLQEAETESKKSSDDEEESDE